MATIEETPVRIPRHIREDAFFSGESNRVILNGNPNRDAFNVQGEGAWDGRPFWTTILAAALTISLLLIRSGFWIATAIIGLVAVVGMAVSASYEKRRQLMQRFEKEGYVVPGEIIQCIASAGSTASVFGDSKPTFYVTFEVRFNTPEGYGVETEWKEARNDLNGKPLPTPGTSVYVLYFNDDECYLL